MAICLSGETSDPKVERGGDAQILGKSDNQDPRP
jgi:hypothetical protein